MIKSGFITIIGKPNVGKSTLLNALVDTKVAITSPKSSTTRHRITAVLNTCDYQMIFVDTPGMHKGKHLLGQTIDKVASSAIIDVDCIILMVDRKFHAQDQLVLDRLKNVKTPVILVINKIDELKSKADIDKIIFSFIDKFDFADVIPISATNNQHLGQLKEAILKYLPEGPRYYPDDYVSDQSKDKLTAEIIREKILYHAQQEVPHAVAVIIESMKQNDKEKTLDVEALIIVERQSQKQIIIGKDGQKLKTIGTEARLDINKTLGEKIYLTLWVKVKKDWRNSPNEIKRYGYGE